MKTAMQELAMVIDNEQDMVDVLELLEKEKQQLIDAFVNGYSEGYKSANNIQPILPNDYINKTYNNDKD